MTPGPGDLASPLEAPRPGGIVRGVYYPAVQTREIPWEKPGGGNATARLWATWKFVTGQPGFFFATLSGATGVGRALLFSFVFVAIGQAAALLHGEMAHATMLEWVRGMLTEEEFRVLAGTTGGMMLGQLMLFPVWVISAVSVMLVHAAGYHLAAWLVAPGCRFDHTLRVVCYAQSTHLFSLIPVLGCVCVQPFYYLLLVFLGMRTSAGLTTGQALFVVFFPILLIVFIVGGVLFEWILVEVVLNLVLPGA